MSSYHEPWPEETAFLYILKLGLPRPSWLGWALHDLNTELALRARYFYEWRRKQETAGVRMPLMTDQEDRLDRLWSCIYYFQLRLAGRNEDACEWKTWALDLRDWSQVNRDVYDGL